MLPDNKVRMGTRQLLNPRPAILVGTIVNDKPNFLTVSWAGITSDSPPSMSIAIRNIRYSLKGIIQNNNFSVNIPSSNFVNETDYCGNVSGEFHDKVKECELNIFYGVLKTAPLIEQCPINIECEILHNYSIGNHSLLIGKIIESYISDNCFTNNIVDITKIDPLCFCSFTENAMGYYKIGPFLIKTGI